MFKYNGLVFRKPNISDLESLYIIKNEEELSSQLGGFNFGYSMESILDWIKYHQNRDNEILWIICEDSTKEIIGHVGLYNIDYRIRKAEFGILLSKKFQGKKYGEYSTFYMIEYGFNQLNLNKIYLSVNSTNTRAYNLYKKLGFKEEGILKNEQFKNGTYIDTILMAIFNKKGLIQSDKKRNYNEK